LKRGQGGPPAPKQDAENRRKRMATPEPPTKRPKQLLSTQTFFFWKTRERRSVGGAGAQRQTKQVLPPSGMGLKTFHLRSKKKKATRKSKV